MNLIIGNEINDAIFQLCEQLKKSTVDSFNQRTGKSINKYNPWLCFQSETLEIPDNLIFHSYSDDTPLIRDKVLLDTARQFMLGKGSIALNDLFGKNDLWAPDISTLHDVYNESINLIKDTHPVLKRLFEGLIEFVIPLGGPTHRGYSTHFARGAIFRCFPLGCDEYDMAFYITHELGHNALIVWQSVDPIITSDLNEPVFSEIRRTNRPAIQTFHAALVLSYMLLLEKSALNSKGMVAAAKRQGKAVEGTLQSALGLSIISLQKTCTFSEVGYQILSEMIYVHDI